MRCTKARGIISIVVFDPDNGAVHDNNIIIVIKKIIVFQNLFNYDRYSSVEVQ